MIREKHPLSARSLWLALVLMAALLAGCGGSSDSNGDQVMAPPQVSEPNAPAFVGNTATDGFNWFNFRRIQMGLAPVTRNALLDSAAQGHSEYQRINDTITHEQSPLNSGFTGRQMWDRLQNAGYRFTQSSYAYGEVISATGYPSGFAAAEELITAIYHRFVILEPMFTEAGSGSATVPQGYTYFTTNFTADGLGPGLPGGEVAIYPVHDQANIPTVFYSDRETPDPVPDRNEVGYPVSVHANIVSTVTVTSFTIHPRGGAPLSTRLLSYANDSNTASSVAAIVPLNRLASKTVYDVQFQGAVDGQQVSKSWSFTTQ